MKPSLKVLAFSIVWMVAVLLIAPGEAHAFTYSTCNGGLNLLRWGWGTQMYRDRCSMPDNSDADWAYYYGGSRWWEVAPIIDHNYWYNNSCTIGHNGMNETALVDPSSLPVGVLGTTTLFWNSSCTLVETDIRVANNLWFDAEDESFYQYWSRGGNSQQGRVVLAHEFGHALGLGHYEGFDIMRAATPYPLAGGNTAEPYPDDANGARFSVPDDQYQFVCFR